MLWKEIVALLIAKRLAVAMLATVLLFGSFYCYLYYGRPFEGVVIVKGSPLQQALYEMWPPEEIDSLITSNEVFSTVERGDIDDLPTLVDKLRTPLDPVSLYLYKSLSDATREELRSYHNDNRLPVVEPLLTYLVQDLNKVIRGAVIYDEKRFTNVHLREETRQLIKKQLKSTAESSRLNRMLMEDAYPIEIQRIPRRYVYELYLAARLKRRDYVEILIKHGADVAASERFLRSINEDEVADVLKEIVSGGSEGSDRESVE